MALQNQIAGFLVTLRRGGLIAGNSALRSKRTLVEVVVAALASKGYCVIQTGLSDEASLPLIFHALLSAGHVKHARSVKPLGGVRRHADAM